MNIFQQEHNKHAHADTASTIVSLKRLAQCKE